MTLLKSFNPRTHEGCDRESTILEICSCVSIHAPTRGATQNFTQWKMLLQFQSTHPRGVRLKLSVAVVTLSYVSIHAPTRGATAFIMAARPCNMVSIHAPTRGATTPSERTVEYSKFQSTHPRGVRL